MRRALSRGVLALALLAGPASQAATPATPATPASPAASHAIMGTWNRYPQIDEPPDPKFPAPKPIAAPPLKAQYLAAWQEEQQKAKEADARGQPLFTGYVQCLPDGMPSMMMGMFPMEVLQTPGQVTIVQEAYSQIRRIYLNEKPLAPEDAEPGYWGHSAGRWEGSTLVVDTVGIKETVRFRNVPHSPQMRIHERIHLVGSKHMVDEVTIEDPVYLEAPWSFTYAYERLPGYKMMEYVCDANREYKDPVTGGTRLRVGPAPPPPAPGQAPAPPPGQTPGQQAPQPPAPH